MIPIGADIRVRKPPYANYILIALNVAVFVLTDILGMSWIKQEFRLDASWPSLGQYVTYQFLHGDFMHLAGNMLFLWIFGNAVCDRMTGRLYILFYVAGGIFAGITFAQFADNPMVGASGSIAAVTTAFLVLFPRVQITILWLFIIITAIEVPALLFIGIKIILWDNIVAPGLASQAGDVSNVAYSAHLGGYAFGFLVAMVMLMVKGLPRHQFDLLAIWDRWGRRTGVKPAMGRQPVMARPGRPADARVVQAREVESRPLGELPAARIARLRGEILEALERDLIGKALDGYRELLKADSDAVLPRREQLQVANELNQVQRHSEAAVAYERYLSAYADSPDAPQVLLLLGLLYHRYLHQTERAVKHLEAAVAQLPVGREREFAEAELAALRG